MTFPLPTGICRKVCRPPRNPPRRTDTDDVVRMARAAVRNGADPCELAGVVRRELGCACSDEALSVQQGLEAIAEDRDALRAAFEELLIALGILAKGSIPQAPPPPGDPVWRQWLRRIRALLRWAEVAGALYNLWEAVAEFSRVLDTFVDDVARLLRCIAGEK